VLKRRKEKFEKNFGFLFSISHFILTKKPKSR